MRALSGGVAWKSLFHKKAVRLPAQNVSGSYCHDLCPVPWCQGTFDAEQTSAHRVWQQGKASGHLGLWQGTRRMNEGARLAGIIGQNLGGRVPNRSARNDDGQNIKRVRARCKGSNLETRTQAA